MAFTARPEMIDSIIQAESGGDPNAVNKDSGAIGLMQILPSTARDPGFGIKPIPVKDLFDPIKNRAFGTKYYNAMLNLRKGNVAMALASFNAGPARVGKLIKANAPFSSFPKETQGYVTSILGNHGAAPRGIGLTPEQMKTAITDQKAVLSTQEALAKSGTDAAKKARIAARARLARRDRFLKKLTRLQPNVPPPNFRPAPSGGGGRGVPLAAATGAPVAAPGVDPVALQQSVFQGLLNPATSAGAGGLLAPTPPRRRG